MAHPENPHDDTSHETGGNVVSMTARRPRRIYLDEFTTPSATHLANGPIQRFRNAIGDHPVIAALLCSAVCVPTIIYGRDIFGTPVSKTRDETRLVDNLANQPPNILQKALCESLRRKIATDVEQISRCLLQHPSYGRVCTPPDTCGDINRFEIVCDPSLGIVAPIRQLTGC